LKLTTDRHEASHGLFVTAELLVNLMFKYSYTSLQQVSEMLVLNETSSHRHLQIHTWSNFFPHHHLQVVNKQTATVTIYDVHCTVS